MKKILVTLISLTIAGICQAAEPQLRTFITRGDDKIVYSGGKEGLRAILLSFLKVESDNPIKIHSEMNRTVVVKEQQMNLGMKSQTHSFEVINGYHRFTVLPEDPGEEVYAITADESFEGAVIQFIDSLYKFAE